MPPALLACVLVAGLVVPPTSVALDRAIADVERLFGDGRGPEAVAAARRLVAQVERRYGETSVEAARVRPQLVRVLCRGGQGEAAETLALAERAVREADLLPGPPGDVLAANLTQLSEVLTYRDRKSVV